MSNRSKISTAIAAAALLAVRSVSADVTWTGTTSTSWATGSNWSNNAGPGTTDIVDFNDPGASTAPGNLTSQLNVSRTIGALQFNDSSGKYHTLDLNGDTLTVTGNLNINLNQNAATTETIRDGSLVVSGPYANLNVGRAVSTSATGTADLTGLSSFTANLQTLQVGTATAGGGTGTLLLSPSNTITASIVQVGSAVNSGDCTGTLTFGLANTVNTSEFDVGNNNSTGSVSIISGGSLTLGSAAQPTLLQIANQTTNTNNTYSGSMNLGTGAVNLTLSGLVVAEKNGGPGGCTGQLTGGGSGSITIGTASAPANWIVADTVNGGSTNGTVGLGSVGALTANLVDFSIGISPTGSASGTVTLPQNSTITASDAITVGAGQGGSGSLTLGKLTTLITPQLTIGQDYTTGVVQMPTGGTLNFGTVAQPGSLSIGVNSTNTNQTYSGQLNLSGSTLNAFVNQLTVGSRNGIGGGGGEVGTFTAGNGSIVIGPSGNVAANVYVGQSINSPSATGTADFSGLSTLSATVNTFSVGVSTVGGGSQGTVLLAASNVITANSIVVGSSGNGNDTLTLGRSNTIQTPSLIIGQNYSNGSVVLPVGGSLTLGSASQRTGILIANDNINTNLTYTGSLDVSGGAFTGYLGSVALGLKAATPGNAQATFSIGSSTANYVDVTSITLGGNGSSGVLNYGGGTMFAGTIAAGTGSATFNWTGGRLSVGTFGTAAIPFNLNNTGFGNLTPGTAANPIGTTSIFGNFNQGAAATTSFDIAGTNAGTGYDQVNITGTAALAGTIALNFTGGFTPVVGDVFELETYASNKGSYGTVVPPSLPAGMAFQLDYSNPGMLLLELVTPNAQAFVATSAFTTFGTAANYSPAAVPGTANSVSIVNTGSTTKTVTVSASTTVGSIYLKGQSMPVSLSVGNGITLAVASQLDVDNNATLNVQSGGTVNAAGGITGAGTTVVASGATLTAGSIRQAYLTVNGSATIPVLTPHRSSANLSVIGQLSVTGTLDLGNSDLDLQSGNLATVTSEVAQAFNLAGGANWTGTGGITSTAARTDSTHLTTLGVIQNNQGGSPIYTAANPFDGNAPGAADILVKYTYFGDANLDGKVDGSDYSLIDAGYASHGTLTGWLNGDFNYDGVVDGSDYALIDNAFNNQTVNLSTAAIVAESTAQVAGPVAVPEPASIAMLSAVAAAATRRRRCFSPIFTGCSL